MPKSQYSSNQIDGIDLRLLDLLIKNLTNKQMSSTLEIPLSTVQRRVRNLTEKGIIVTKNYIEFKRFGFKSGSIHIYLSDGNMDSILDKLSKLKGVTSLEVHIGNSDIIAGVVYKEGKELLNIIAAIKGMVGVDKIVWSERIFEHPVSSNNVSLLKLEQ